MLRVSPGLDPFLSRPFSIFKTWQEGEDQGIGILYRVVGRGTELLSRLRPGDQVYLLGPLGRGFSLNPDLSKILLIGGGTGVAPLFFLAQRLLQDQMDRVGQLTLLFGAKSYRDLVLVEEFDRGKVRLYIATEDGSAGHQGVVTELVPPVLERDRPRVIYAGGPAAMLRELASILTDFDNIRCQASMEERMACGIGACLGCAIKTRTAPGPGYHYQRVCREGPVFNLEELYWE